MISYSWFLLSEMVTKVAFEDKGEKECRNLENERCS